MIKIKTSTKGKKLKFFSCQMTLRSLLFFVWIHLLLLGGCHSHTGSRRSGMTMTQYQQVGSSLSAAPREQVALASCLEASYSLRTEGKGVG